MAHKWHNYGVICMKYKLRNWKYVIELYLKALIREAIKFKTQIDKGDKVIRGELKRENINKGQV